MHRFFIEPETLSQDRTVWIDRKGDIRWRYLIVSFREKIRNRNWKLIDLSVKLFVKVETWDNRNVLVEDLDTRNDYYLASAYLKAGLLERTPIMVFAKDAIPWESLREFRAVNSQCNTRNNGGAVGHNERTALGSSPEKAIEERVRSPSSLDNETSRTGKPDILAGGYRNRPQLGTVDLAGERTA